MELILTCEPYENVRITVNSVVYAPVGDRSYDGERLDWIEKNGMAIRSRARGCINVLAWGRFGLREAVDRKRAA